MIRTQIYLTERQRSDLAALSKALGKKQSELIREAIDRLIEQSINTQREIVIQQAAGMWKKRYDLPDFESLRTDWDRQDI